MGLQGSIILPTDYRLMEVMSRDFEHFSVQADLNCCCSHYGLNLFFFLNGGGLCSFFIGRFSSKIFSKVTKKSIRCSKNFPSTLQNKVKDDQQNSKMVFTIAWRPFLFRQIPPNSHFSTRRITKALRIRLVFATLYHC